MNHIIIELCAEDRARLDKIIEKLENVSPRCDSCVKAFVDLAQGKAAEAPEITADEPQPVEPKQTQPEPEKAAAPKDEDDSPTPEVTVEDIRSKVLQLSGAGKKDAVRAIITQYAPKVTDIPADKRAEVLEKLTALEG